MHGTNNAVEYVKEKYASYTRIFGSEYDSMAKIFANIHKIEGRVGKESGMFRPQVQGVQLRTTTLEVHISFEIGAEWWKNGFQKRCTFLPMDYVK